MTWTAEHPIPLAVAEGPGAHHAIQDGKADLAECARSQGLDPAAGTYVLVKPEAVAGVPVAQGVDPIYGTPVPAPYVLTLSIQENQP